MNQKRQKQAALNAAIAEATAHYDSFNELIGNTYSVRKHGSMYKGPETMEPDSPDYKPCASEPELDNLILQGSMRDAIVEICNAAFALIEYGCEERERFFKTAILWCETVGGYEHVNVMANVAAEKNFDRKFFLAKAKETDGRPNINKEVTFDIDIFLDKLTLI